MKIFLIADSPFNIFIKVSIFSDAVFVKNLVLCCLWKLALYCASKWWFFPFSIFWYIKRINVAIICKQLFVVFHVVTQSCLKYPTFALHYTSCSLTSLSPLRKNCIAFMKNKSTTKWIIADMNFTPDHQSPYLIYCQKLRAKSGPNKCVNTCALGRTQPMAKISRSS